MTLTTRPALLGDAGALTALLNEIIAIGGSTAYEDPFTPEKMRASYIRADNTIACTVAERDGEIVGFQTLFRGTDGKDLPDGWGYIATFVRVGATGGGIGRALFGETREAARHAALATIDATIRTDNASGLRYYDRMGFVDYDLVVAVPLKDGTPVDRIRKRFDL